MSHLLLPKHMAASLQRRDRAVADGIAKQSMNMLASDDFVTADEVRKQMDELREYVALRRESDATYELPQAVGWRILVLILTSPKETSGGLHITGDSIESKAVTSPQGVVLDVGPAAYQDRGRFAMNGELVPWCVPGDRIIWKRYDLTMFQIANGQRLGFLNDTQPVATLDSGWLEPETPMTEE